MAILVQKYRKDMHVLDDTKSSPFPSFNIWLLLLLVVAVVAVEIIEYFIKFVGIIDSFLCSLG